MGKRFFSTILALCLLLTLLPGAGAVDAPRFEPAPEPEEQQPLLWDPAGPEPEPAPVPGAAEGPDAGGPAAEEPGPEDAPALDSVLTGEPGSGIPCTVTLNPGGGTLAGSTTAKTGTDGKLTGLPGPTREGYTFTGWYTAAEGGTRVTGDTVFTGDATVYAHWVSDGSPVTGDCGSGVTWTCSGGTLTIRGTGATDNWVSPTESGQLAPWYDRREQIETVTIGSGVTSIGSNAFFGCSNLTRADIPDTVAGLGNGAFRDCSSLEHVTIPKGVTDINYALLRGCSSLRSVDLPDTVTSIGYTAFYQCASLETLTIPGGVTSIDGWAFCGCSNLKSLIIPQGVTVVAENLFYGCSSLEHVTIPEDVKNIGEWAFTNCASLKELILPQGLSGIAPYTFSGCSSLERVTIPQGVTGIGAWAFHNCASLKELTLPQGLSHITLCTFRGCRSLERVTIPESVRDIGERAFESCASLKELVLPQGLSGIAPYTFYGCSSLERVTIPQGVTGIEDWAFGDCKNLCSLSLPDSVTSIGQAAFYGCGLEQVYYNGSESRWAQIAIAEYNDPLRKANIHHNTVPDGTPLTVTLWDAGLDGNGRVSCTVSSNAPKTVLIAAALYEQSGRMREKKLESLVLAEGKTGGVLTFLAELAPTDYVKIFLLDPADRTPLCPAGRLALASAV